MNTATYILSPQQNEKPLFLYFIISKQEKKVFQPLASPLIRLKKFCPELMPSSLANHMRVILPSILLRSK